LTQGNKVKLSAEILAIVIMLCRTEFIDHL
jgi:hypothetical protein